MALSKREKNLAIITGVLVLPFAAWLVVGALGGSTKQLSAQQANLINQVNDAKKLIRRGHEAQERLDVWNRQSLPRDVEAAGSLYKIWLMKLCESKEYNARFQNTQVKPMKNQPVGDVGTCLSFNVSATASLEQLVRWLYGFYSADYLHQIKGLTITPLEESKKLNLVIQIEAMVLNGATDADGKARLNALQEHAEEGRRRGIARQVLRYDREAGHLLPIQSAPAGSGARSTQGGTSTEPPALRSRQIHAYHRNHRG